jgi:ABC-type nitrate/sulfonate/bicarbonate transport system substrate-binding protein
MTRRSGLLKLTCIAIWVWQVLGGSALFGAETPALRGLHNALGGTMTPAFIAQDLGLFSKHGLEHSLQYIPATTGVQALAAGSEEIGLVGNQCVDVGLEGADTVYVASTASRFIFQLYGAFDQIRGRFEWKSRRCNPTRRFDRLRYADVATQIQLGA